MGASAAGDIDGAPCLDEPMLQADLEGVSVTPLLNQAREDELKAATFRSFSGIEFSRIYFIEIFAGTARLSKSIRDIGFQCMPIDHSNQRASQIHICDYELTDPNQLELLIDFIKANHEYNGWIHFAPSCGTASRARERPLPNLEKQGFKVAKPLRSDAYPLGLPNLSGWDKQKVELANLAYEATSILVRLAHSLHITCSIENPLNSLFWPTPDIKTFPGYTVVFDHCCHGGTRCKTTAWWSNHDWFVSLAMRCDGGHPHAPWAPTKVDGKLIYPTAEEAAYPSLLCERLASIFKQNLLAMGAFEPQDLLQQRTRKNMHRFLLEMLPRGRTFKPLVSCYQGYVMAVHLPHEQWQNTQYSYPKGAASVSRRLMRWGSCRAAMESEKHKFLAVALSPNLLDLRDDGQVEVQHVGIPREPQDFVAQAVLSGHPRTMAIHLPEEVKNVLQSGLEGKLFDIAKQRVQFFWKWTQRAKELSQAEMDLKDHMPDHLKGLLSIKRLKLFAEMLEACNYPDKQLVRDI